MFLIFEMVNKVDFLSGDIGISLGKPRCSFGKGWGLREWRRTMNMEGQQNVEGATRFWRGRDRLEHRFQFSGIQALWLTFSLQQTTELPLGKSAARALRPSKIDCERVTGPSKGVSTLTKAYDCPTLLSYSMVTMKVRRTGFFLYAPPGDHVPVDCAANLQHCLRDSQDALTPAW